MIKEAVALRVHKSDGIVAIVKKRMDGNIFALDSLSLDLATKHHQLQYLHRV